MFPLIIPTILKKKRGKVVLCFYNETTDFIMKQVMLLEVGVASPMPHSQEEAEQKPDLSPYNSVSGSLHCSNLSHS